MSQVSWQVKFHYIAISSLKKVFSTGMRSKNFMFVVRVGVFLIKLDIEKYHKGQRVHSADESSLGTRI